MTTQSAGRQVVVYRWQVIAAFVALTVVFTLSVWFVTQVATEASQAADDAQRVSQENRHLIIRNRELLNTQQDLLDRQNYTDALVEQLRHEQLRALCIEVESIKKAIRQAVPSAQRLFLRQNCPAL